MRLRKILCAIVLMVALSSVPSALNAFCDYESASSRWGYISYYCTWNPNCEDQGTRCLVEIYYDPDKIEYHHIPRGCRCSQ